MARNYANILTAIWKDEDFRRLTGGAQRCYLLLATQSNISAVGLLPLTVTRWAGMASDTTTDGIEWALKELVDTRFVVVDEGEQELLVRSFTRWDNGYGNPRRRPSIRDAAREVCSAAIQAALRTEFERLGLPAGWVAGDPGDPPAGSQREAEGVPDGQSDSQTDSHSVDEASPSEAPSSQGAAPIDVGESSQVDWLNDSQTDCVSPEQRVVVTQGLHYGVLNPQPSTLIPHPAVPPAPVASGHRREVALVARLTGADDDEARRVVDEVRRRHRPANLGGYLRTMGDAGDLGEILSEIREGRARAVQAAQRAAAIASVDVPPPPGATPEEAAEARRVARAIAAGRRPPSAEQPQQLGRSA